MNYGKSVAIVGVGGLFPGAPTLADFWDNILGNVSSARRPPKGRWLLEPEDLFEATVGAADKVYSLQACFIEQDLKALPLDGLAIDPHFLRGLDPLFHLLLHAGSQAFRDGNTEPLDRRRIGVIIGNLALPSEASSALARDWLGRTFAEQLLGRSEPGAAADLDARNGQVAGLPAGLLARSLGLGGCAFTLDAACASSLYAIKLAADELVAGRADAMLTGGLSRPDSLYTQMGFSQLHALSPSGVCSPFDQRGDGLVVGEGCGMLLLKRTEDAVRDGDHIYAVIRGLGLSNDIGGNLLAPASEGQLRAMRAAYQQAGWAPSDVELIECHATGTPVGDAVEFASLRGLWGESGWRRGQCVIGSVKSNIGHLLTAAGSAAVLKTLLAMKHQTLPPTANFQAPAKGVTLDDSPFRIMHQGTAWEPRQAGRARRAAVSAFGFGGINAHLLLEEWLPAKPATRSSVAFPPSFQRKNPPIAIIGLGAHFGPWESLQRFQQRVLGAGEEIAAAAPDNWWGAKESRWFAEAGLDQTAFRGHFIPEVAASAGQFRIPPKELAEMLPRQLLMLQVAEAALRDAGLKNEDLLNTGVYVGAGLDLNATNFTVRWGLEKLAATWAEQLGLQLSKDELAAWVAELRDACSPPLTANRTMGALGSTVASRIAKEFRIGGPSFTLSSEENSGLSALQVAVRALQEGSINRALVGAADCAGDLRAVLARHAAHPFSASGRIRPFDEQADGTIIGEGGAALVLKRLEEAQRDGDRIYAVIRGVGAAVGGAVELACPDSETSLLALQRTFHEAGCVPETVGYVETHGSGAPAEDAAEGAALQSFFGQRPAAAPCYLGSVKADIGHAGSASGLASLVKAVLCLYQQILPPLRGAAKEVPAWPAQARAFRFPSAPQYWLHNRADGPRRALVSGFGSDGSCSHVLLEGWGEETPAGRGALDLTPLGSRGEALFALEADTPAGLLEQLAALHNMLTEMRDASLESLAARWLQRSPLQRQRRRCLAMVAGSRSELTELLRQGGEWLRSRPEQRLDGSGGNALPGPLRDRLFYSPAPLAEQGGIAFVFPGSGNHFAGMGQELSATWPEIFRRQDAHNLYLAEQFRPADFWRPALAEGLHDQHNALVIGQVALGTAVSDLVRGFGIEPQAVSGYSLGESAGLFSFGAWHDRDGMAQRLAASSLFTEQLAGPCLAARQVWGVPAEEEVEWLLGLAAAPAEQVQQALVGLQRAYLLIINTPGECVIGGERRQVEELIGRLGCHFLPLRGVTTVHCAVAMPVAQPYRELHRFPTTPPAGIRFYSGAWGKSYELNQERIADAILAQALETVDYPRLVEQLYQDGVRLFLEMGPGNSCSRMIGRILHDRPHLARSACYPGQSATSLVLRLLAQCLAERVPVDLARLYPAPSEAVRVEAQRRIVVPSGGAPFHPPLPKRPQPVEAPSSPIIPISPMPPMGDLGPTGIMKTGIPQTPAPLPDWQRAAARTAEAHGAYLRFAETMQQAMAESIGQQMELLRQLAANGEAIPQLAYAPLAPAIPQLSPVVAPPPAFDRRMCMEFAIGSIAAILGPEFAEVDTFPTRVRLPDEPLMLVDRIIAVEGEPRSMGSGRVITEHDVTADRWYLDGGRIPTCVAVEAGQADLFLSGYLGIDFITRGLAVYRLLDAVVTFHRALPVPGDVIRYDIRIERFFRQDQTYLFRFSFEGTVNGEPLLSMQKGCAGFFSAAELAAGKGIVHTRFDLLPQPGIRPADWRDLAPMAVESYSDAQMAALRAGDLAGCFGPAFAKLPLRRPATLPAGLLKLVDRVIELDPAGGRFGIGLIRAEADIHPDDWFLTSHFCDDHVMPGTLMYECCLHTLRIYLLRLGWIGEADEVVYQPVPGVASQLKCRGQVIETTRKVTYEVSIKELGYRPEPYAIVNALMYADGKPIVEIGDMTVRLSGLNREKVEALWHRSHDSHLSQRAYATDESTMVSTCRRPLYDYERILAFAVGKPSEAFGEPYRVFDEERRIARLPGPPFQFLDRIVAVQGEPWKLVAGATVEAEYDVPADAWYFAAGRQPQMPFSVLLETGLQPCGWLAAYLGSALTSPIDLSFRNLDGRAVQHRPVTPESGTLTTRVKITRVASSGGMIIQGYDFAIHDHLGPVYSGDTVFGFFSKEALAQQVGVRDAKPWQPSAAELRIAESFPYPEAAPFPEAKLRMVAQIDAFLPEGGPNGLGYIRGSKKVDPGEWFFQAHFYQDPVWPGSLGLESFLQLLKAVAVKRWGGNADSVLEAVAQGVEHRWNYRGQIVPGNKEVSVEAVITAVDDEQRLLKADGFLSADGKIIYQLHDFSLRWRG
jgi:acyl transferase domain-containing protein/3-hydroxymyristoyl/3-hydroxydecanoyl-(acyl carrier protein) dehydratase